MLFNLPNAYRTYAKFVSVSAKKMLFNLPNAYRTYAKVVLFVDISVDFIIKNIYCCIFRQSYYG